MPLVTAANRVVTTNVWPTANVPRFVQESVPVNRFVLSAEGVWLAIRSKLVLKVSLSGTVSKGTSP